jgi:hypothetical protein
MKKTITSASIALSLIVAGIFFMSAKQKNKSVLCETCGKNAEAVLRGDMHKLWEDHVTWTRNVILCMVDDLPGTEQALNRLMKNQEDIGNAVKPYYKEEGGKKLTDLLKEHISISGDVIKAAKASNKSDLDAAQKKWSTNAEEISKFLSSANPNWKLKDMKKMMDDHLALTTDEVVQRIKKNYDADVEAYDKVHAEILKMADMLTEGIVKQFPDKFKKSDSEKDKKVTSN